jgi:predicted phosphodiesterase
MALRVQYVSDLHLEFSNKIPQIQKHGDVLVLAGDIGYPFSGLYKQFLEYVNSLFDHTFLVIGNHEYYGLGKNKGKSMEEIEDKITELVSQLPKVTLLNGDHYDYGGYRFVGITLWTEIIDRNHIICDFRAIKDFNIGLHNELHMISKNYIDDILGKSAREGKKVVMITHHLPSFKLITGRFKLSPYNQCFASTSDYLFRYGTIALWVYGHSHEANDIHLDGIRFVCNPKGYPDEVTGWSPNKVISLSS